MFELYSESDESETAPEVAVVVVVWRGRTEKWTVLGGASRVGVGNRLRPSTGDTWVVRREKAAVSDYNYTYFYPLAKTKQWNCNL